MKYKFIRLEFISVIVRQQIAGNNSLRKIPVGNACGDNGISRNFRGRDHFPL